MDLQFKNITSKLTLHNRIKKYHKAETCLKTRAVQENSMDENILGRVYD